MRKISLTIIFIIGFFNISFSQEYKSDALRLYYSNIVFKYDTITGIGHEIGVTRRDPSDIIKVGDTYHVYYTKVKGKASGYWGTIWHAISKDEGYTWIEKGEVLGIGAKKNFDAQATFTPNIIEKNGRFYLFYTGVSPTPYYEKGDFENNSTTDITAIGLAVSKSPYGPFKRVRTLPILEVTNEPEAFDSFRIDDAVLFFTENQYRLYYKGRSKSDGINGPKSTKLGVAFSDKPEGPYTKYGIPLLDESHEVMLWKDEFGIGTLASISRTFEHSKDGLDFKHNRLAIKVKNRPNAPGVYRPDLTQDYKVSKGLKWGISMVHNGPDSYLIRFNIKEKE